MGAKKIELTLWSAPALRLRLNAEAEARARASSLALAGDAPDLNEPTGDYDDR